MVVLRSNTLGTPGMRLRRQQVRLEATVFAFQTFPYRYGAPSIIRPRTGFLFVGLALLTLCSTHAFAQAPFVITGPPTGSVFAPGQPVTVTWTGGDPAWSVNVVVIDSVAFTVVDGAPSGTSRQAPVRLVPVRLVLRVPAFRTATAAWFGLLTSPDDWNLPRPTRLIGPGGPLDVCHVKPVRAPARAAEG